MFLNREELVKRGISDALNVKPNKSELNNDESDEDYGDQPENNIQKEERLEEKGEDRVVKEEERLEEEEIDEEMVVKEEERLKEDESLSRPEKDSKIPNSSINLARDELIMHIAEYDSISLDRKSYLTKFNGLMVQLNAIQNRWALWNQVLKLVKHRLANIQQYIGNVWNGKML